MIKLMKFKLYEDGGWRWKLMAANGNVLAQSGGVYKTKASCVKAIHRTIEAFIVGAFAIEGWHDVQKP